MSFREKLRELRKSKNLQVKQLAQKSGVSSSYLSMLENGLLKNDPTEKTIHKIEKGLNVPHGSLAIYAVTGSTQVLREICIDPKDAKKINTVLAEVLRDRKILDKLVKAVKN